MKRNYHPSYEVLASLFEDEFGVDRIEKKPFQNRHPNQHPAPQVFFAEVICCFLILILICISTWYFFFNKNSTSPPKIIPSEISKMNEIKSLEHSRDLEQEITLMKEVLSSLISTVETLSQKLQPIDDLQIEQKKEFKPVPFRITTPNAHLRQYPRRDSDSLGTIQKDTILMGVGFSDGWVKTFTPSGKEAWVHSSVTLKLESENNVY